jgi:hypothetical protein
VSPHPTGKTSISRIQSFPRIRIFFLRAYLRVNGMVEKGDGRRRDAPTPEEIEAGCRRIRKGWKSGERILRRSRWLKKPWRLPEIHGDENHEDTTTEDQDSV